MSNDQTDVTTPADIIGEEARAAAIKTTKKIVLKKVCMYVALITTVVAVERLTRVDTDETEEDPDQ